ncbi:hypothetical protein KBB96_01650 [Luteolibacter ambystomatis]|uniref:Lipoprotein n=1 Tax=Luteolibacter ambystomatis TaxID=2824561 RepID=A0A975PEZ0_9BACT|nr:hypothetical protein [Luteolibacter ambystomatis]QUE51610.1 hypothetical protein KBB96_01650 [Luteolibacter ambystomatis]
MNLRSLPIYVAPLCLLLASCGTMTKLKDKTTAGLTKVSRFSVSDLMPARIDVVEVRQKDLKEFQTGQEKALAFENTRRQRDTGGFWGFFRGPVDFKEPTLPNNAGMMDGSLLPPRAN